MLVDGVMVLYEIVYDRIYVFTKEFPYLVLFAIDLVVYRLYAFVSLYLTILNQLFNIVNQLIYLVSHLIQL